MSHGLALQVLVPGTVTEVWRPKPPPTVAEPATCAVYVWIETISGMIRIATMLAILIIGLIAGPAVSL